MATGDKLYLADKETLDIIRTMLSNMDPVIASTDNTVENVKTNTQSLLINTSTSNTRLGTVNDNAGTFSVFALLKYILNNTLKDYQYTVPSKLKYGRPRHSSTSSSVIVFSSNTSGTLYSVVVNGVANNGSNIRITVDGTVLLYMDCSASTNFYGGLIVGDKKSQHTLSVARTIQDNPLIIDPNIQSMGCLYSPLPIRAESSVVIECLNPTTTDMYIEYTYIED